MSVMGIPGGFRAQHTPAPQMAKARIHRPNCRFLLGGFMRWMVLLPGFLGMAAVLQGGLNRQIAGPWGLAAAALFNTLVLLAAVGALLAVARLRPAALPELFQVRGALAQVRWWWILPGLFGFALVTGIPFAISRLGAFPVFVGILVGQMITSLAWDALLEGRPLTAARLCGAVLAIVAAVLVGRGK
jgi:transporter family-2 protein